MFQGRAGAHSSRRLASFGPRPRFEGRAVWQAAARFGAELHRRDFKDGGGLVTRRRRCGARPQAEQGGRG